MSKKFLILYTIFSILISSASGLAATPPKFRKGQLKGSLITEFYTTDSNYDKQGGSFESLPNDNKFTYIAAKPSFTYGLTNKVGLSTGLTYAYGKSETSTATRTNGAVTDANFSLYYKLATKSFYLLPQIRTSVPILTFDPDDDKAIINEGALRVEFGAWVEKKFLKHRFYFYTAYAYQGDGRAHFAPWEVGAYNSIGRFLYGGSIWGQEIISDDEFIDSPETRSNRTDQFNAGSLRFYAVNPNIMNAKAWAGMRIFNNFLFYLKYEKSINGSNTANGQSILAELKWRIINPRRSRKRRLKIDRFQLKGVDSEAEKLLNKNL